MRVGLNLLSLNNSQPIRKSRHNEAHPSFEASKKTAQTQKNAENIDYKAQYENLLTRYKILLNVTALMQNPALMNKQ